MIPSARLRCAALALQLLALSCGPREPGQWHDEATHRWRELAVPDRGRPGFTLLEPSRTGIDFQNSVSQEQLASNRHLGQGSGVALGDVDGDALVDIYVARIDGPNALYRNLGRWRFEEIAEQAGVAARDRFSTGVVLVDVDGDLDLDLLVTALGGPNSLFVNDGTGRFTEMSEEVGLTSDLGSMTATFGDIEGDGDLDLFIGNYKVTSVEDIYAPWERTFDRVVLRTDSGYHVAAHFADHYRVTIREDLDMVVRSERANPDWFYINDGSGRFEQVPLTAGRFFDASGNPITSEPENFVLTARFFDADGDGDPDLYVCADFEDPDHFWINNGDGTFTEAPPLALRNTSNSAMAVDFSDVDRDGDVDLFEVDMLSREGRRRKTQKPTHTAQPKLIGRIDDRPQMMRNTLHLNRGDGTYAEAAGFAGIDASGWSWAAAFLDVDLDGYEDLLLSTGHIWDVMDFDTDARLRRSIPGPDWRRGRFLYPRLELPNVAFHNKGDLTFDEAGAAWGFGREADISHGIALGDLDQDGDLDVVVNRMGSVAAVYRNDASEPRVAVRLLGDAPNTQGVGAKIRVIGGAVDIQYKEVVVGGLYLSSSDPLYTFATGSAHEVTIEVTWRKGRRTVIEGARPNRLYEIRESGAEPLAHLNRESVAEPTQPLFSDRSGLLQHTHHEAPFDDFTVQPLLPNSLALLGPGVSWYDVDEDGDEDLLLTSGSGGRLSYYRNDGGRFAQTEIAIHGLPYDQTAVLAVPGRLEGTSLLVGHSNYEARTRPEALTVPGVVRVDIDVAAAASRVLDASWAEVLSGGQSAVGALAIADYDADGDLDLFVGGRVLPGRYPESATSHLLVNAGGEFENDASNVGLLDSLGLVSAATFSDVDADGDPDLLLAMEWGPVTLLLNERGRFSEAGTDYGIGGNVSRWNGVTTGDFNEDGIPDVIATSWGRNTVYHPSDDLPILLYFGDYDRNGVLDIIEAQRDPDREGVYPLALFPRVRAAMPRVTRHIQSFLEYADATVEDLVGNSGVESVNYRLTSLDHVMFLSHGDSYRAQPLPAESQLAPAFYAGVADFDGDGHEDLFLSQNFFPTEIETPRFDAGRGLLLKGDGTGKLATMAGQLSGVRVYGDQRGAAFADYDADGRADLVVSQSGAMTKLYHNDGARPGIRVRLVGPPGNPHGYGSAMRVVYHDGVGPVREVHGGSGYWSQDGAIQVLGLAQPARAIWVRWPGGRETEVPVTRGQREVEVRWR